MEILIMLILSLGLAGSLFLHFRRQGEAGGDLESLRGQLAAERAKVAAESARRTEETAQLRKERDEALASASALEQDRAASAASKRAAEETLAKTQLAYDELEKRMREAFASAAQAQLTANREQFLGLAEQKFAPFKSQLEELNRANTELKGSVKQTGEQSAAVAAEARKLAEAMRSTNRQGAWGELQLARVVELTGMVGRVDFNAQVTVDTEQGQLRPDMVISLPGGKNIVLDAKAPTKAFIEMGQATNETDRARHAKDLAAKIRGHANQLGSKRYWEHFKPTPEFVVLFLPSEALFAAALNEEPSLMEEVWGHKVVIATPMTLLAMLRGIAHSWQQVEVEETALKVIAAAEKVHDGVRLFGNQYAEIGRSLNDARDAFNTGLDHLQSRILSNAEDLLKKSERLNKERALAEIKKVDKPANIVPQLETAAQRKSRKQAGEDAGPEAPAGS